MKIIALLMLLLTGCTVYTYPQYYQLPTSNISIRDSFNTYVYSPAQTTYNPQPTYTPPRPSTYAKPSLPAKKQPKKVTTKVISGGKR